VKRAIRTHLGDFAAILVLLALSVVVAGYVLSHERFNFPFFSPGRFTMTAEFATGQAFTAGQGQSVDVSGVQIGQIGGITLKDGIAYVTMSIDDKYKHLIHTDATALARPRTGLQDMFIELDPGTLSAPVAKSGFTIPVSNTNPEVNSDEIEASLDADTREYLDLLVNGAGEGLQGKGGDELAKLLERFEPTHQDLARLNSVVAERGTALRQLINSLQRLNTALAAKQSQIVQLVDSSSKVFSAWASENQNVSKAVQLLPSTLQQTTSTLQKVQTFANILGPAASNLLPAARALPAANQALTQLAVPGAPIVQNQIRPFVVAARPVVRNLRPAAINLSAATPNLEKTFTVLNHLVNMLGYSPGGSQHGYLWWLAWLDHNVRTLFSTQDANGDYRPIFLQANCASITQIASNFPPLEQVALGLSGLLGATGACPASSGGTASTLAANTKRYEAEAALFSKSTTASSGKGR
jgi:phospholipid/cholesterol/gamma-HCH transport system substrate-binding protein